MRKIHLILVSVLLVSFCKGQSLITNFPEINPGGYVNAVLEDTISNKIYIAGNFTSVNGAPRKNLARLSYNLLFNTYSVDNWIPVTAMTGEINCLAFNGNSLYIGGNYTAVNGNNSLDYFTRLTISTATFDLSFLPDANGTINTINDFSIDNNRLFIAGTGTVWDDNNLYAHGFAVFDLLSNQINPAVDAISLYPSMNWGSLEMVRLHITDARIYLCGKGFGGALNDGIIAIDKNNYQLISSFNPSFTFEQVIDCESYNGNIYIVNSKIWPGGESVMEIDETTGNVNIGKFSISNNGTPYSISRYKNYLFIAGTFQYFQSQLQNYLGEVDLTSGNLPLGRINWEPVPNSGFASRYALQTIRNKLYLSNSSLITISATSRAGIAAYCLEPLDPVMMVQSFSDVCPGDSKSYSIQPVPYSFGYSWWYSGTDVTITGTGITRTLSFGENATSGILSVAPFSKCNLYSDTLEIPVTVHPKPDADAGLDSTLNCVRFTLDLAGNSSVPTVSYEWNGPSGFQSFLQNPSVVTDGEFILTVTNTTTGCKQNDTVLILQDTIRPDVQLPAGPFVLTCSGTTVFLNGNSLTTPTSLYWNKFNGGIYPNPFYADSIGQYFLVVTNTRNGCKDSSDIVVVENRVVPQIEINSHPGILSLVIDTLTCVNDSLLITGSSSTPNTIIHWEDTTGIISLADSILINNSQAYVLIVTDTVNGCSSERNFFISEFKTPPQFALPVGLTDLTCSNDSLLLDANAITGNTDLFWNGPGIFNSPDPVFISDTGYFVLTAILNDNGCSAADSLLVSKIPLIQTQASNDSLVCSGSSVDIYVNATGNFSQLNYTWSSSSVNANQITVNPVISTEYFVNVDDGNGCNGSDTIMVFIPPPVNDSILTFASCDSAIGQIQVYAFDGLSPYEYSVDNGMNFQPSGMFNVPFGEYDIVIKDSLGCLYFDSAIVNENSQLPEPDFLVSTYSFIGDTLVLVNISNPVQDSLVWTFPGSTDIILDDVETPWILLPDTGYFSVSLKGFWGDCFSEKIKTIYVRETDTSIAGFYNQNGIDTIIIYPNPNAGNFNLEVTFFRKQDFSVIIYDLNGIRQFNDFITEEDYYSENIQLGYLQNGTYLLRVTAEFDARSVYFIIQH